MFFNHAGKRCVTRSDDPIIPIGSIVKVWNTRNIRLLGELCQSEFDDEITLSHDDRVLANGSHKNITIWCFDTLERMDAICLLDLNESVMRVFFLTKSWQRYVVAVTKRAVAIFLPYGDDGDANDVIRFQLSGRAGRPITFEESQSPDLPDPRELVNALLSPCGRYLVISNMRIRIFEIDTLSGSPREMLDMPQCFSTSVELLWSNSGKQLAIFSDIDRDLRVLSLTADGQSFEICRRHASNSKRLIS